MKQYLKKAAVLGVAILLCLSLVGCQELDRMRAAHAKWDKEGNIVLGEYTYRLLPAGEVLEYLQPDFSHPDATVYVTTEDVPLLLSDILGYEVQISADGVFLSNYDEKSDVYELLCRADRYDEIASRIENGVEFTQYGYEYYDYMDDEIEYYRLTDEQVLAVETVVAAPASAVGDNMYNFDSEIALELYTEDKLFRKPAFTLCLDGDSYCIAVETKAGTALHTVPATMNKIFLDIMAPALNAEKEWMEQVYDDWDENSI